MKPGHSSNPDPSTTSRCFRPPLRFVTLRHKLDLAVAGTDRALKRRRVAGVDGRAVDEEVEVRHRAAALRRGGERAPEADGGERHAGADEREDGAEAEWAEEARGEDDAADEPDQPDCATARLRSPWCSCSTMEARAPPSDAAPALFVSSKRQFALIIASVLRGVFRRRSSELTGRPLRPSARARP